MKTNKKKNFKPLKIILTFCVVCFVVSSFYSKISDIQKINKDIDEIDAKIAESTIENQNLQEKKLNLHTEENYREIAKKELGLVEPGDKVYINSNDN